LFDFIIPVYRTTRRVRRGFREMHEQMNGQATESSQPSQKQNGTAKQPQPDKGDYIDFEEIKVD